MKTIFTVLLALFTFAACAEQAVRGTAPALNPDGRSVAYLEFTGHGAGYEIVVRDLEQAGHVRVIDSDVAETQLAWSPDGRTLAYVKLDSEQRPVLWRVRGDERVPAVLPNAQPSFGVAFLDDQRVLAGLGATLVIAAPDGTVTTAADLSETDLDAHFESISVSPSGRVAFTCGSQSDEMEAICVLDLKEPGAAARVTSGTGTTPSWRAEDEIVFSRAGESWRRGPLTLRRHHLWSQNLRTGQTRQLTFGDVVDTCPTVDRSGRHLMSARLELAAIKPTPKRQEKNTTAGSLEAGFETLEETIRQSTIVTVDRE
jgi:hypothetical protein